jgi:hypothetical protein
MNSWTAPPSRKSPSASHAKMKLVVYLALRDAMAKRGAPGHVLLDGMGLSQLYGEQA